ncbi:probable G-protein coupled receptor 148 [Choloepus didactylus]|uniref:probable G-protein coupled receptor 148 n=1 Tax=Choloepus didactylus TaxID=27675 RepID=UPI00189C6DC1|nr:probable G-protein coupled receptor 148 [Choloepus didactylus]
MVGQLAPSPLGTMPWPALVQHLSETPHTPQSASTPRNLGVFGVPISTLRWLFLPSILLAAATLALSPLLLVTILRSQRLRREPHYLLLANVLLSDLAYILCHMLISTSNLGFWELGRIACGFLTDAIFVSYTSTILSFTASVLHTCLAVTRPLHYLSFVSHGAARKAVALIWLVACFFPTFLVWLSKRQDASLEERGAACILQLSLGAKLNQGHLVTVTHTSIFCILFLCLALITYCFFRIYIVARTSGAWTQGCARARGTLLIHTVIIVLYVSPVVMFSLDILLMQNRHISVTTHVWLLAANSEVLMMVPRAMLPYLYMLRYRQLLGVIRGHFSPRRHSAIFTISQSCRKHSLGV